ADLETAPQADLETAPQADLETAPQADLVTDTKEAPPLQQLYKKLLSMAKPLRWNSDGCSLINPRHHPAESAVSFQLVCPGSGYLISVTVGQEAPPDGPLSVACDRPCQSWPLSGSAWPSLEPQPVLTALLETACCLPRLVLA
uniref:Cytokine receptor-like factor 2 n=1 Tax=Macrostomum lignano TaxID=282301 RepID=A0A1I8GQ38_9PLAT